MTDPWTQEMSSLTVGGPQTASMRIPVEGTPTRTCSRCMALTAVRVAVEVLHVLGVPVTKIVQDAGKHRIAGMQTSRIGRTVAECHYEMDRRSCLGGREDRIGRGLPARPCGA